MASVKVILRKKESNSNKDSDSKSDKPQFLYLRVLIERKARFYSLKKEIDPAYWIEKEQKVSGKEGNALFLNKYIGDKVKEVESIFYQFQIEQKALTINSFNEAYSGDKKQTYNFYSFFDKEYEIQKNAMSAGGLEVYRQMRNKLKAFAPNLNLSEITHDFIARFENNLLGDCKLNRVTTSKHLTVFKTYVRLAFHKGYIKTWFGIRIKKQPEGR